jgi:HAD superfamily hydrolase (TIGR01490 family)
MRLTLFDLDHTLLRGDSDVLWCEFLMQRGLLERAAFEPRSAAMARAYEAGTVDAAAFCSFYVATLAGRTPQEWEPARRAFLHECIAPRLTDGARALVRRHREAGDLVVLTTATNRFITELTAAHLGIEHLIATGCELDAQGRFSGRLEGTPNMREGKVEHLARWLAARGSTLQAHASRLYSDSINDLPLLAAVHEPVVVDPDAALAAVARERGWPVISLR